MVLRTVLEPCAAIYAALILVELLIRRQWFRFWSQIFALLLVIGIALLVNNSVNGRVAFGESTSPVATVIIMFLATISGIAGRYIFYFQKGQFSILGFLKPIAISPIVLLPLIGSIQTTGELNNMQVVSFALLAFQNGFFWQAVLEGARPVKERP
jgi:hypothetical protein